MSPFHSTFGYYAHGVGLKTAVLPMGWEGRLVALQSEGTRGATAWCLEPHDLILSKLVAGREKDVTFARVALEVGLVCAKELVGRAEMLNAEESVFEMVKGRVARLV